MNRRTFNSHGVTWKSNTNPVNGSHRIDLNRMLRLVFFNWFFFVEMRLKSVDHTRLRTHYTPEPRYDQTHNTILIVCNYRLKDHLSVYFKEKEKCSLLKQVRSRVVEKVKRLHYMELTEVNRNKTYDVERKTMISIEREEKKKKQSYRHYKSYRHITWAPRSVGRSSCN